MALLLALTVLVTWLIGPNLYLVPARYDEGKIITQTILINENVQLKDEKSSKVRLDEAIAVFAPIFDYDPRLRERIFDDLTTGFRQMREGLAELNREKAALEGKIRKISLDRIFVAANLTRSRNFLDVIEADKSQLINEIGRLTNLRELKTEQQSRLEKLRFDLQASDAQITAYQQSVTQLAGKGEQLENEGRELVSQFGNWRVTEEQALLTLREALQKTLRIPIENSEFRILAEAQFSNSLEGKIKALQLPVLDGKIVSSPESIPVNQEALQIQTLDSTQPKRFEKLASIVTLEQVRARIQSLGQEQEFAGEGAGAREMVIALAQRLVRPNLTENKGETERQKQELIKTLSPVYFNLKKGTVVARAGEVATAQQVEIINALNAYNRKNPPFPQLIGTFIIVLITLLLVSRLIGARFRGKGPPLSELLLMAILVVIPLILAQIILWFVPWVTTFSDFIPRHTFNFLIPAALTAMLASILLRREIALFLGFATSLFLAILLGNSLSFFIFAIMGSLVAALPMRYYETRNALWLQGMRIAAINLPVVFVLNLMEQNPFGWGLALALGAGLANGLGVAILVLAFLPLLERVFDITTNLRLLELSNMNHPALKELAVRAPGTYHHSIVVGNLSESAAGGIGANPLLVRVASYYHDLGKMTCPLYFVENQRNKNYHDDLPAKTSARIIINHVKDGAEIARRYRLGRAILNILEQHHGTSLVRYFFHKAEAEETGLEEPVDSVEFRYPGPKPQSKEAGLVMVADVTEAATRSMPGHSPEAIQDMVIQLTNHIYMDGQLDESGLTFNDLNHIKQTFTKMLLSIHHHRITYPDLKVADGSSPEAAEPADETAADSPFLAGRRASS